MPTIPPAVTPPPALTPQRGDRTTFSARMDAFITWFVAVIAQLVALVTNCYNNAVIAYDSALGSAASAANAAASANVTAWVSGTNYLAGDCRWSPIDFLTYRRKTNGAGATDPSADAANWGLLFSGYAAQGQIVGKNKLLNTNFENPINQRYIASRITTAGAYNFDCWYYGADTKFYQAADYLNLSASQQYTINWSGTATAEYLFSTSRSTTIEAQAGWTAIAKGAQINAPADVITGAKFLWVRWTGVTAALGTFDKPQLEEGGIATTYERRLYSQVLAECQRYLPYFSFSAGNGFVCTGQGINTTTAYGVVALPVATRFPVTGMVNSAVGSFQLWGTPFTVLTCTAMGIYGVASLDSVCLSYSAGSGVGTGCATNLLTVAPAYLCFTGGQI